MQWEMYCIFILKLCFQTSASLSCRRHPSCYDEGEIPIEQNFWSEQVTLVQVTIKKKASSFPERLQEVCKKPKGFLFLQQVYFFLLMNFHGSFDPCCCESKIHKKERKKHQPCLEPCTTMSLTSSGGWHYPLRTFLLHFYATLFPCTKHILNIKHWMFIASLYPVLFIVCWRQRARIYIENLHRVSDFAILPACTECRRNFFAFTCRCPFANMSCIFLMACWVKRAGT